MSIKEKYVLRFSRLNRGLHIFMIVSFIILSLTGMSLKFSYSGWAKVLSKFFGGFESAGYWHRFAAIIMIIVFTIHLVDLVRLRRKEFGSWKALLIGKNSMLFNKKDWSDFKGSLKWFLGKGERPSYGRWTYWEKFDYFAVFWGMFVIGSTGMSLWFPEFFTIFVPGWMINVATIIHSDEALLASGFIFTVHFFNTHLRPEKFPMDPVIFTGTMPLDELKHERPREYAELVASGKLDEVIVEPVPRWFFVISHVFGFTALGIGLTLVISIIFSMVYLYL